MSEDFSSELSKFDGNYKPAEFNRPGLETLPDGSYEMKILGAELTRTQKNNELILRLALKVMSGLTTAGKTVERAYFFRDQQGVDSLGADLCSLGFDADQWHPPARPFSKMLVATVPMLIGVRFNAVKKTNTSNGKQYHNLYVRSRLPDESDFPAMPGSPASSPAPAAAPDDDIPF